MVPMVLSPVLLLLNFFGILNPASRQIMNALDGKLSGSFRWNSERWGRCFGGRATTEKAGERENIMLSATGMPPCISEHRFFNAL